MPSIRQLLHRAIYLTLALILLTGCDSDSVDADGAFMGLSIAETGDDTVRYVAVHEDGELLGISVDPETGAVTHATLLGDSGEQLSVSIDLDGLPDRLVVEDYVFVFENVRATEADVVMITPSGDIHVARDVPMAEGKQMALLQKGPLDTGGDIARAAQGATIGLGIASCIIVSAMSVTGTFATLGVTAPATGAILFGCGSAIASVIAENQRINGFDGTRFQQSDGAFTRISNSMSVLGCGSGSPFACAQLALAAIQAAFSEGEITENQYQELIEQAEAILRNGGGDVQISLTWNTTADIDLWVTDPSGERIYYGHRVSASGGEPDVDDTDGLGPENIFWPRGSAPSGSYQVQVDHYSGASPTNWTVTTVVGGETNSYAGTLVTDQTSLVTTFSVTSGSVVQPMTQDQLARRRGVVTK